jgi:hypothetical protein
MLPAVERYDGPAFRTFRKWRSAYGRIELIVLSAKHGFIPGDLLISD